MRLQNKKVSRGSEQSSNNLIHNYDGQYDELVNPPDTVGDVGTTYYIQAINSYHGTDVTIFNKIDGSIATGPFTLDSLCPSGNCSEGGGDPIVFYDRDAERWLLSEFSDIGDTLCIYISQTSDPTGSWLCYQFNTSEIPDYPKYGVWPDAYYVSTNEASGPTVYALQRSEMLNGQPATMQEFTIDPLIGFGFNTLTPADLDGPENPPIGAPGYFMRHRDDELHNPGSNHPAEDYLELWEFSVDWSIPGNSTFKKTADIAVEEFDSDFCSSSPFECFDQPGTSSFKLDALPQVILHRLQYRNFGDHETLVGNFVTDVDGTDHGGIRWFELRKTGQGNWDLYQEGTYAPDGADRWMGSVAMDGDGNIALGYNIVDESTSIYPGIRYASRLASDPSGILPRGEYVIVDGQDYNSNSRYGDYSAMSVDPADDRTFWFTGEYNPSGTGQTWRTRIAAFRFGPAGGINQGVLLLLLD